MDKLYDVLILGAGPAGLTAALYASRARLSTLIIDKAGDGGQIAMTDIIENYPGSMAEGESGASLTARMAEQAAAFGAQRTYDEINAFDIEGEVKTLRGAMGEYRGKTLIIASGMKPRPIGCEHEDEFVGRGISFCATCDAPFFRDADVYVAGGGDSAVKEAIYLTKFARSVTVIHRRDALRASKALQEKAFKTPNLSFIWDSVVETVGGGDVLERLTVKNVKTGETREFRAAHDGEAIGLFGFIGSLPETSLLDGKIDLDGGFIVADEDMRTSVPGVFAAGDIRRKHVRQVVTAAADGAIAAVSAENYIEG